MLRKLVSDAFRRFTAAGLAICIGRAVDNRRIDERHARSAIGAAINQGMHLAPSLLRRNRRPGYVYLLLQCSGASAMQRPERAGKGAQPLDGYCRRPPGWVRYGTICKVLSF